MGRQKKLSKKDEYYLHIAKAVASRSTCSRRKFGAIIVKDDVIMSTGYNGTMRGSLNCGVDIPCLKDLYEEEHFSSYDYCPAIHAEENACLIAGKQLAIGGTMYISSLEDKSNAPCFKCRRKIGQVGIDKVIFKNNGDIITYPVQDYPKMDDEWMMELLEQKKPNWAKEMIDEE